MELEVGSIVTGKITGITKFGAFVTLAPGKSGLVHISEIANSYVNDIREHLTEGQEVTVKIIGLDNNGRINLSIKAALPQPAAAARPVRSEAPRRTPGPPAPFAERHPVSSDISFEDKLKRFMQDSDSKISGLRQYADKKGSRRRGR
jgi:S1 RNA binding domain protein